jgi:tetratricopeptide (TPR) repeat protein
MSARLLEGGCRRDKVEDGAGERFGRLLGHPGRWSATPRGNLLRFTRRCEEAIPELEISLAANRNNPDAFEQLSMCKFLTGGSNQEAIALTEQAIRFSPRDPNMQWWYTWIGFVHLLQSRIDEAIAWLERARSLA